MNRYILPIVAALWGFVSLAYASPFTLLSQNPHELVIEFKLPEWRLDTRNENFREWQRIVCDDGSAFHQEGYPELISFAEAIGLPIDGDFSIQILENDLKVVKDIDLIPAKKMQVQDYEVDYLFYQDPRAYTSNTVYPLNPVSKGGAAFIGNRHFAPLQVIPFQYLAAKRELWINSYIKLKINIQGSKEASKDWQTNANIVDDAADAFFLNNATSKSWRMPRQRDNSYVAPKSKDDRISEIQFVVDTDGIYRVSYQYLNAFINASIDTLGIEMAWNINDIDPRYLELRDINGPVPIHFLGESDGAFDPGEYFEFYGVKNPGKTSHFDAYTNENVYTLGLAQSFGARMAVENGGLIVSNAQQYIVPDAYEETVHFEQQIVSDKLGRGWTPSAPLFYKEDVWFWKKISAPNLDIIPIELQYPRDSTIRTFSAEVGLHGLTYSETSVAYDHDASVRINQAMINSHTWLGQTVKIFRNPNPLPNSFLRHGINNIYISLSGNTPMGDREQILFDYATIKYWREYRTDNNLIKFTKPSNRPSGLFQFQVEGFSSPNVSVYKIGSSVFNNLQIEPFNLDGIAPWTVTFQDSVASNSIQYYAVEDSQKKTPKFIRINFPSDLKSPTNFGDVLVITPREFVEAEGTQTLVELWNGIGYNTQVVDLQDIFDEFNGGIRSADAIKSFIRYAYDNWSIPQLKHVILLGEGTDDERDNSPNRKYNQIPIRKMWTYKHGATASDNWYVCILGEDTVADLSIARINVWNTEQIAEYAQKAVHYHTNALTQNLWSSHVTFTAGGKITDPDDIFSQQSERIRRKAVPPHYRVSRVYTSTQSVSPDYFGGTFALKDAINSGTQYVQFMGHGGGRIWADYNLFNFNDVATLNNQAYPFVMSLACYASAFDTPGTSSLSEALVIQPNKGAISTLGFSGLGYLIEDEDYGLALNEAMFKHNFASLGEAITFAKARFFTSTTSPAPRYALTIGSSYLGDPLIRFRKPITDIPVSVNKHLFEPGDTLRVSAQFAPEVSSAKLFIMKENEKTVNVPFDLPVIQGVYNASYVFPTNAGTNYLRKVYVAGYSNDHEYLGSNQVAIGRANIMHHTLTPTIPTWRDSLSFTAIVHPRGEVTSVQCRVYLNGTGPNATFTTLQMSRIGDSNEWRTDLKLQPIRTGREIEYIYVLDETGTVSMSPWYSMVSAGPDLFLSDIRLEPTNNGLSLKVLCKNIGNAASTLTDLRLYIKPENQNSYLHKIQDLMPLAINEERWETVMIDSLYNANLTFEVRVNWSNAFPEWHIFYNTNNVIMMDLPFNYFIVNSDGASINSVDGNLSCDVPANVVSPGENSLFYVHDAGYKTAFEQPDISTINLASGVSSKAYQIGTLDSSIIDSLGVFNNNKKVRLTFQYSATDSLAQYYENENSYHIYRWHEPSSKWIHQGGIISTINNRVVFDVNRTGIYSLYRNRDRIRPSIDVNVQDQEFTVGGYISGKGTLSLLLSDANGIDVVDNSISMYLNGNMVSPSDYVISVNPTGVNRIPIKYQINLSRGSYGLVVDCKDVNGNFNSREIQFIVNDRFDIVNVANYPNPVVGVALDPKNDGRTRFTYVLTDDADAVSIKIYTVSGRLVKTFANLPTGVGYHEFPRTLYGWDCKDEQGFLLANGVYFYKITAKQGSKTIEKTHKMAILK